MNALNENAGNSDIVSKINEITAVLNHCKLVLDEIVENHPWLLEKDDDGRDMISRLALTEVMDKVRGVMHETIGEVFDDEDKMCFAKKIISIYEDGLRLELFGLFNKRR